MIISVVFCMRSCRVMQRKYAKMWMWMLRNTELSTSACCMTDCLTFVLAPSVLWRGGLYEEMQEVCVYVCVCVCAMAVTPLSPYCTINCDWMLNMSRSVTSWPPRGSLRLPPWTLHQNYREKKCSRLSPSTVSSQAIITAINSRMKPWKRNINALR